MDEIHIGHIDDENYTFYGKLSDGTPVYKHTPPPLPDPSILKEESRIKSEAIDEYNRLTEFSITDTSKFLQIFNEQEEKEKNKKRSTDQRLTPPMKPSKPSKDTKDEYGVLDYMSTPPDHHNEEEAVLDQDIDTYLDLFKHQEEKEQKEQEKRVLIEEQKQRHIETECDRRNKSAQKYKDYLAKINQDEIEDLKNFEHLVAKCETELHDEYSKLLESIQLPDFYDDTAEYHTKTDISSKTVTIVNKNNNSERVFNYLGELQTTDIIGYKLRLYSIVRGDRDYGIIRESYNYLTHRHMVYDLRTGQAIRRETFIISKLDPTSITSEDPDVYSEGITSYNQALAEPVVYEYDKSGTYTVSLSTEDLTPVDPSPVLSEVTIELYGAGGAGSDSNASNPVALGGAGGAYITRTFSTEELVGLTDLTLNVGSGLYSGVSSVQAHWDNQTLRQTKDTYVIVGPITAAAGGGRDAIVDDSFTAAAFQGQPMYSYDVGYYGMGAQEEFYLSAAGAFTEPDSQEMIEVGASGFGGWGAALSGHGSKTFNIGASGGYPGLVAVSQAQTPGNHPGAGGGAADPDEGPGPLTVGASGADGYCKITISRIILNAE